MSSKARMIDLTTADEEQVVHLEVAADVEQLRLIRLVAAAVGTTLGFDVLSIDELRLAVDEIAAATIDRAPPGARLSLRFHGKRDTIVVEGSTDLSLGQRTGSADVGRLACELDPATAKVLGLLTDAHSLDAGDGLLSFRLVKRTSGRLFHDTGMAPHA